MNIIELSKNAGFSIYDNERRAVEGEEKNLERFAALVQEEVEAEWIDTSKALAKEIIVKNEALKLAEEALETDVQWGFVNKTVLTHRLTALAAIREALAEPVKQEPKYWTYMVNNTWRCIEEQEPPEDAYDEGSLEPLYAASVDAKAIRAEALEEAAKVCDELVLEHPSRADKTADQCAAAIRGLK